MIVLLLQLQLPLKGIQDTKQTNSESKIRILWLTSCEVTIPQKTSSLCAMAENKGGWKINYLFQTKDHAFFKNAEDSSIRHWNSVQTRRVRAKKERKNTPKSKERRYLNNRSLFLATLPCCSAHSRLIPLPFAPDTRWSGRKRDTHKVLLSTCRWILLLAWQHKENQQNASLPKLRLFISFHFIWFLFH